MFLKNLAFYSELYIALNQLRRSCFLFSELYIELFTLELRLTKQKHNFLIFSGGWKGGEKSDFLPPPSPTGGGRTSSNPPFLISRDFRSNFSCSIFFFLLASCFFFLHFEVSPNSSFDIELWSRQQREMEVCKRKGIRDCSLCSFYYILSELRGIQETHNCTPNAKWGVVSPKVQLRGIFHCSPVLTAGRVKTGIIVHGYTSHANIIWHE